MHLSEPHLLPLLDKLARLFPLCSEDQAALLSLPSRISSVAGGTFLARQGDATVECAVLIRGFAYRSRTTAEGGRQILSIQMRGDAVNLQGCVMEVADQNVQALTDADIVFVPHAAIINAISRHPRLGQAFWRQSFVEASIVQEWMINIGRRNARQRVSHFICEFAFLQTQSGLARGPCYSWPLTQEQIGDATGLSTVHVNRVLQGLRNDGYTDRPEKPGDPRLGSPT